ncbi:hypothetical protein [Vitiosangium sp. GDMCC 1.1324]|uniref:hypothetical protein n=1 Tax=Vitiosangium sp. (strain GDMCC 1.1324) TaxID=2138576 RepID=UPI000D3B7C6E|nr:hypothetical protein [Vitiosangium sp. GDMCC 1.1324]PTL84640.1 hypothetical protein DAT35_06115 [Vitiosangium sp. GDMCC 1.1324]
MNLNSTMPQPLTLSSGLTVYLILCRSFAVPLQGVNPTEADMDEIDSMLSGGITFLRPPQAEEAILSTSRVARVQVFKGAAMLYQGSNPRMTNAESHELRHIMRGRGIQANWWCESDDER